MATEKQQSPSPKKELAQDPEQRGDDCDLPILNFLEVPEHLAYKPGYRMFSFLLKDKFRIRLTSKNPALLFCIPPNKQEDVVRSSYIKMVAGKYGFPITAAVTGECISLEKYPVDYTFSVEETNNKNCNWVNALSSLSLDIFSYSETRKNTRTTSPPPEFCALVALKNDADERGNRRQAALALMEYKHVDCAGGYMNNTDKLHKLDRAAKSTGYNPIVKREFLKDYKFSIAFENNSVKNYVTEKIIDAFMAGNIPIYWGCPNIAEYFNPDSFVNVHDYDSIEDAVARVREIDTNPDLYEQYRNAVIVPEDSRLYEVIAGARARVEHIVQQALIRQNRSFLLKLLSRIYGYAIYVCQRFSRFVEKPYQWVLARCKWLLARIRRA